MMVFVFKRRTIVRLFFIDGVKICAVFTNHMLQGLVPLLINRAFVVHFTHPIKFGFLSAKWEDVLSQYPKLHRLKHCHNRE
jgi:hypothetical protein